VSLTRNRTYADEACLQQEPRLMGLMAAGPKIILDSIYRFEQKSIRKTKKKKRVKNKIENILKYFKKNILR
jgi:hypothetical protein